MTDIDQIVLEAKETFDLSTELNGRTMRKPKIITTFTDESAGEDLGWYVDPYNHTGVLGKLGEARQADPGKEDTALIVELELEAYALLKVLNATSYTFTMNSVHDIVLDVCRRAAKKEMNIKGKVQDDVLDDYSALVLAYFLTEMVQEYTVHSLGIKVAKLDLNSAKALKGKLPPLEYMKLDKAIHELQYTNAIGGSVTADADFSHSI